MPVAKTKTSKSSSSASSSAAAPAAAAKSLKAAGKQKATEKPASTAEAPTTKKRVRIEGPSSSKPVPAAAPKAAKVAKSSTSTSSSKTAATKPKTKATVTSSKPPAKKLKKSPLTSTRPVSEAATIGQDSDEGSLDSDEEAELLKGVSAPRNAVADDEADSSDEDDEDVIALKKYATSPSSIPTLKLPSSRDDAAVRARLDRLSSRRQSSKDKSSSSASSSVKPGALYVGRLPRHFTELPLRKYFEQFGTITRLRLSRNKKTGASKHYAFIEFADEEVAKIVQETMDNYLILNQLLSVKLLPREDIHPRLWVGANRTYRPIPKGRRARVQHDAPKTVEQKEKVERRLVERQQRKKKELKELGIDYEFEGYTK